MMAISSRSCAASSERPPLSYSSTASWRCFIIFCNTPSRSASLSGGLPCPRASMSAFLMVELTMRSVESLRSSLARIASLTALLMSSRSIFYPLAAFGPQHAEAPDLGGSRHRDNTNAAALAPQPFDQRIRGRLGLLQLRQVTAMRENPEFGSVNAAGHLLRQRILDGVVLVAGQNQGRAPDRRQHRPRVRAADNSGLLAHKGLRSDILAHVMNHLAQGCVLAPRRVHEAGEQIVEHRVIFAGLRARHLAAAARGRFGRIGTRLGVDQRQLGYP